jgi:hypothetical protein
VSEQNRGHERDFLSGLGINAMTAGRAGQTTASTTRAALDGGCLRTTGSDAGVKGAGIRRPISGIAPLPKGSAVAVDDADFRFDPRAAC